MSQTLRITTPLTGQSATVVLNGAEQVELLIDINTASMARVDNDLSISLDNGSKVLISDFFAPADGASLPEFVLEDGTIIDSQQFFAAMAPDMDITTAAGPTAGSGSSGLESYADAEGTLVNGVESMQALGTERQANLAGTPAQAQSLLANASTAGSAASNSGLGSVATPEGEVPGKPDEIITPEAPSGYTYRSVLYSNPNGDGAAAIRIYGAGNAIGNSSSSWSVTDENGYFILPPTIHGDGLISFTLSDAGKLALQETNGNIYDSLQFIIDGKTVEVQMVVTKNGNFNAFTEDALNPPATNFEGTWHSETNGAGTGTRVGDAANDEVLFIQGTSQKAFAGNLNTGAGNDSITIIGDLARNAVINAGTGDDSITITGQVTAPINGGEGNDTINANGNVLGQGIFGDFDKSVEVTENRTGGNDSITIKTVGVNSTESTIIAGDAARVMGSGSVGGDDTIKIDTISTKTLPDYTNIFVSGDAYQLVGDAKGGNDSITIGTAGSNDPSIKGSINIAGDSNYVMTDNAQGGNDTIRVETMGQGGSLSRTYVTGDGAILKDNTRGGNDSITIGTLNSGYVGGDAYGSMQNNAIGGNDTIHIDSITSNQAAVAGDAGLGNLSNNAQGGDDYIYVGHMSGVNGGAVVSGDAQYGLEHSAKAGNDTIHIGTLESGRVYGDAQIAFASTVTLGNDSIRVDTLINGFVAGDGDDIRSTRGGDDTISIGLMQGGIVTGDSSALTGGIGGNDNIHIEKMEGGMVFGDVSMQSNLLNSNPLAAGDDLIRVDVMSGGTIYGDTKMYTVGGDDTIIIGELEGSTAKAIYGNAGNDLFIYDNAEGHILSLDNNGQVTILGADGTDITSTTNTTITGFEGLGGGSGNDRIIGNDGNNLIMGGAGNDTMTGGLGSDTFVWHLDHLGTADAPARDIVTDFSRDDKLDLSDILGEIQTESLGDYLHIIHDDHNNTVVQISSNGQGASGNYDQVIVLENTTIGSDDLMQQIILQSN